MLLQIQNILSAEVEAAIPIEAQIRFDGLKTAKLIPNYY